MSPPSGGNRTYGSIPTVVDHQQDQRAPVISLEKKGVIGFVLVILTALVVLVTGTSGPLEVLSDNSIPVLASPSPPKQSTRDGEMLVDIRYDNMGLLYCDQFLDHIGEDTENNGPHLQKWCHRYFKTSEHWKGPGHPILVILGGEGPLEPEMLYPFIHQGLANEFGAYVISPEHRFYGESQPVLEPSVEDFIKYLTPDQAMADTVNIITWLRENLGCSPDPNSKDYCPVITFGASYPGFLSAILRFRFPDYIDAAYAASAPLLLYSQKLDSDSYNDKVTEVAEIASPGCADAVRSTLYAIRDELLSGKFKSVSQAANASGFCIDTFPHYIQDVPEFISEAITFLVPAIFADYNMGFYPPGPDQSLTRACKVFQDATVESPLERLSTFFKLRARDEYGVEDPRCFDVTLDLPTGPHARIRGSDNSGSGGGYTGEVWEFQCCQDLIIRAGYSPESMFLPRHFSYDWHEQHCHERFPGVRVEPFRMVNQWHFDDLSTTTRILFTNGLRDGWSTGSILETENPHLAIINMPNGAHHSDLRMTWPDARDTPDVVACHEEATETLQAWLQAIMMLKPDHQRTLL